MQPAGGVAAESAAAATLFFTSAAGIPVSTTHTITGGIVGVGAARRLSAVRWGVAGRVVWAWVLTIPGRLHHRRPGPIDPVGVLMTDRRARFFLLAALVCLIMIPIADHQFRTLTLGVSATYVLLALASYLDFRSRKKSDSDVP